MAPNFQKVFERNRHVAWKCDECEAVVLNVRNHICHEIAEGNPTQMSTPGPTMNNMVNTFFDRYQQHNAVMPRTSVSIDSNQHLNGVSLMTPVTPLGPPIGPPGPPGVSLGPPVAPAPISNNSPFEMTQLLSFFQQQQESSMRNIQEQMDKQIQREKEMFKQQ